MRQQWLVIHRMTLTSRWCRSWAQTRNNDHTITIQYNTCRHNILLTKINYNEILYRVKDSSMKNGWNEQDSPSVFSLPSWLMPQTVLMLLLLRINAPKPYTHNINCTPHFVSLFLLAPIQMTTVMSVRTLLKSWQKLTGPAWMTFYYRRMSRHQCQRSKGKCDYITLTPHYTLCLLTDRATTNSYLGRYTFKKISARSLSISAVVWVEWSMTTAGTSVNTTTAGIFSNQCFFVHQNFIFCQKLR